jgi:hypothetical protein
MAPRKPKDQKQQKLIEEPQMLKEMTFTARVDGRGEMECHGVDALDAVGDLASRFELEDHEQAIEVKIADKIYVLMLPARNIRRNQNRKSA